MAINFNAFNGNNHYVDVAAFERSAKAILGATCKNAEIFLMNNFPIDVSTEFEIDFVVIIVIEDIPGNYYKVNRREGAEYLHNLIIPIRVISNLLDAKIIKEDSCFRIDDEVLDYSDELSGLKFGMRDYLVDKCKFSSDGLFIHPLTYIKNGNRGVHEGCLVYEEFSFEALVYYLYNCKQNIFISNKFWRKPEGYMLVGNDIRRVIEQAGKDSEIGYITIGKIERITQELSEEKEIFEDLNKKLVIIEGKAGTGKTSEIMLLMMRCVDYGRNTYFLTYNRLLVYEISKTIKDYRNNKNEGNTSRPKGTHPVKTLSSFMLELSRKLGLLHLISESRINKLLAILNQRSCIIIDFAKEHLIKGNVVKIDYKVLLMLKESIQNSDFDLGTKEVGVDITKFLDKIPSLDSSKLDDCRIEFIKYKRDLLGKVEGGNLFFANYYEILEDILLALRKPKDYFLKYDISQKYDLLEIVMKLTDKHVDRVGDYKLINERAFLSSIKGRTGGRNRTLFVDEGQDCHPTEREILFSIFGIENAVVGSGGYEQLIRHVELCQWNFFNGKKLVGSPTKKRRRKVDVVDEAQASLFEKDIALVAEDKLTYDIYDEQVVWYKKNSKSFRVKKTILDFCNFIANECNIDLSLNALSSEDIGEIIFDFRKDISSSDIKDEINKLNRKGYLNGCTPYESLLLLIDSTSKALSANGQTSENYATSTITFNEYDNIEESIEIRKKDWEYADALSEDNNLWDGAVQEKYKLNIPGPDQCRLLYYESCRGLEAWSVACFNLDRFFDKKTEHPDAEKFLVVNERMQKMQDLEITNEQRKRMFAGTWTLMPLTRAMDTIYIAINDSNSVFSKMVLRYLETNPINVKVLI